MAAINLPVGYILDERGNRQFDMGIPAISPEYYAEILPQVYAAPCPFCNDSGYIDDEPCTNCGVQAVNRDKVKR